MTHRVQLNISMQSKDSVDQRGLVSFMVTIIMMMVISLIVIGFTQITNSNRREQLDRQLSMDAFYAAESGVNAAADIIKSSPSGRIQAQTSCNGHKYPAGATTLSTSPAVGYTCVLVSPIVPSIVTNANPQTSSIFPLDPVNSAGAPVSPSQLTFTWRASQGKTPTNRGCQRANIFPKNDASYTCPFGMVRVDLLEVNNGWVRGGLAAPALAANTVSLFLQPLAAGGSSSTLTGFTGPKGMIVGAPYDPATKTYTATISLAPAAQATQYYMRITTLYLDSPRIIVDGSNATGTLSFANAQANIDSTGKAEDVLRRVQVMIPIDQYSSTVPEGAVQSVGDVCKQFSTYSGYYSTNCP